MSSRHRTFAMNNRVRSTNRAFHLTTLTALMVLTSSVSADQHADNCDDAIAKHTSANPGFTCACTQTPGSVPITTCSSDCDTCQDTASDDPICFRLTKVFQYLPTFDFLSTRLTYDYTSGLEGTVQIDRLYALFVGETCGLDVKSSSGDLLKECSCSASNQASCDEGEDWVRCGAKYLDEDYFRHDECLDVYDDVPNEFNDHFVPLIRALPFIDVGGPALVTGECTVTTPGPTPSPTPSPTTSPTPSPTTAPVVVTDAPTTTSPTKAPTGAPTASTDAPTKAPSGSPTTTSPTTSPTTTSPTKAPVVVTDMPSQGPTTNHPTKAPTDAPTESISTTRPTIAPSPSTSAPSIMSPSPPSPPETDAPTAAPTKANVTETDAPTSAPTKANVTSNVTDAPTGSPTDGPLSATVRGIAMALSNATTMSAEVTVIFERQTKDYIESYYTNGEYGIAGVHVTINVTDQTETTPRRRLDRHERHLATTLLEVIYDQTTAYRLTGPDVVDIDDIVEGPFDSPEKRSDYVEALQNQQDTHAFDGATVARAARTPTTEAPTQTPTDAPTDAPSLSTPSSAPSASEAPTDVPTEAPTDAPTKAPVAGPTSGAALVRFAVSLVATTVFLLFGSLCL